jgi:hypothetical protein
MLFLLLALLAPIIFDASVNGFSSPVGIPTTERAAKISATRIPGMGEK